MQGQLVWFSIYGPPERQTFAIDRYTAECNRLYKTMETYLNNRGTKFFIGDKCTIADIAITSWVKMARKALLSVDILQWFDMANQLLPA